MAERIIGTHPDCKAFDRCVLYELRTARQRALLYVKEIETIGVALSSGFINGETALEWMAEANTLDFLLPTEPEFTRPPDSATTPIELRRDDHETEKTREGEAAQA